MLARIAKNFTLLSRASQMRNFAALWPPVKGSKVVNSVKEVSAYLWLLKHMPLVELRMEI